MTSSPKSSRSNHRILAIIVAAALVAAPLTACGPDDRGGPAATGVTTTAPASSTVTGVALGQSLQVIDTAAGYAATVTVTRVWRTSSTQINADVAIDVTKGTLPTSHRWILVTPGEQTHVAVGGNPLADDFTGTVSFFTPTDTQVRTIRFGDPASGQSSLARWAVPALAFFAPHFKKAKKTTTVKRTTTHAKRTTTKRR